MFEKLVCMFGYFEEISWIKGDIPGEPVITGTPIQMKEDGRGEVLDNINYEKGQDIGEHALLGFEQNTRCTTQNCIM